MYLMENTVNICSILTFASAEITNTLSNYGGKKQLVLIMESYKVQVTLYFQGVGSVGDGLGFFPSGGQNREYVNGLSFSVLVYFLFYF